MSRLLVDSKRQLDAAERSLAITSPPASHSDDLRVSILLEQMFPFPPRTVWDACSSVRGLARWFAKARPVAQQPDAFTIDGGAWGSVLRSIPERTMRVTWNLGDRTSVLDVDFTPPFDPSLTGRAVNLSLTQGSSLTADQWNEFGVIGVGVAWDVAALRLRVYLDQGVVELTDGVFSQPSKPMLNELDEWSVSEPAKQFMSQCAERWAAASIAAGVPADVAHRQLTNTRDVLMT